MANLTYVPFQCFVEDIAEKVHNLGADTLRVALSNTAPTAATDDEFTDITEISGGNGYTAGGEALTVTSSSQTSGTYSLVITSDIVWTASGGNIAAFRYIILYNDTATNDELIGYWDIGSEQNITTGSTYTAAFSGQTLIQIAPA
jgi:hypothetical protein